MKIETAHGFGEHVWINQLRLPARVIEIYVNEYGVQYRLRWVVDNEIQTGLWFEDEIGLPPPGDVLGFK